MTKTKPVAVDQLNSLFESFEFLSFELVCGVRLENIPNFDIAAFALKTLRASNLLACILNGSAKYL